MGRKSLNMLVFTKKFGATDIDYCNGIWLKGKEVELSLLPLSSCTSTPHN